MAAQQGKQECPQPQMDLAYGGLPGGGGRSGAG